VWPEGPVPFIFSFQALVNFIPGVSKRRINNQDAQENKFLKLSKNCPRKTSFAYRVKKLG
jgi:transposase-like protein